MHWRFWLGYAACWVLLGCTDDPATAVIVQVRGSDAITAQVRSIEASVRLGHGNDAREVQTVQQGSEEAVFTLSRATDERRFEIEARALNPAGEELGAHVVRSEYIPGEVRVLQITIEGGCTARTCVEVVEPNGLCPFVGEPLSAGCGADASVDAGVDMLPLDGGFDASDGEAIDEGGMDVGEPDVDPRACTPIATGGAEVESECILPFQNAEALIAPPVPDRCDEPVSGAPTTGCADGQEAPGCDAGAMLRGMFGGGAGSDADPFVICDPRQLHAYLTRDGSEFDGSHVRVVCDLDLVGRPIDETDEPPSLRGGSFRGGCAGGTVRISNLHSSRTFSNALFGELAEGAEVGDLLFDDFVMCGAAPDVCETRAAGIALAASESTLANVHIRRGTIRSRRGSQPRAQAAGIVGDLGGRYGVEDDFAPGEFFSRCLPTVPASGRSALERVSFEGQVVAEFDERDRDVGSPSAGIAGVVRAGAELSQLLVQGAIVGAGGTAGLVGSGTEPRETLMAVTDEAVVRAVVFAGGGGEASGIASGRGTFRNVLFHGAVYTQDDRAAGFVGANLPGAPTASLSNALLAATVSLGSAGERGSVHAYSDFVPSTINVRFASECFAMQVPAAAPGAVRTPPVGTLAEPALDDIGRGVFATEPWVAIPDGLPTLTFVETFPTLPPWSDAAAASYVDASSI
ncbi:MAG: hypothetical protein AAF938_26280 [Myxococcota bacterium]